MLNFREFLKTSQLNEAALEAFVGPLVPILGNNQPQTLNFGGSSKFPPMLYIPLRRSSIKTEGTQGFNWDSYLNSVRKSLNKRAVDCMRAGDDPEYSTTGWKCLTADKVNVGGELKDIPAKDRIQIAHIGEAHVTVAYGGMRGLEGVLPKLINKFGLPKDAPLDYVLQNVTLPNGERLFNDNTGMTMDVRPKRVQVRPGYERTTNKDIWFNIAPSYSTPGGKPPIIAMVEVDVDKLYQVLEVLEIKNDASHKPHATIGFALPNAFSERPTTFSGGKGLKMQNLANIAAKELLQKPEKSDSLRIA